MEESQKHYKKPAIIMVSIPLVLFVLAVSFFGISCLLEFPTHRGAVYSVLCLASLLLAIFSPLPSLILGIIGTIYTSKAKKAGEDMSVIWKILAIVEIVVSALCLLIICMIPELGKGV